MLCAAKHLRFYFPVVYQDRGRYPLFPYIKMNCSMDCI